MYCYSTLIDFDFCPVSWALRHIDRIRPACASRSIGNAVHRSFEGRTGERELNGAALELIERASGWPIADPARPSIVGREVPIGSRERPAVVAGVPMMGTADVLERDADGGLVVSDYKVRSLHADADGTGRVVAIGRGAAFGLRQVIVYAEMMRSLGHESPRRGRVIYLGNRRYADIEFASQQGVFLRSEAERFVATTAARIRRSCTNGVFEAAPEQRCDSCVMASACPLRRAAAPLLAA